MNIIEIASYPRSGNSLFRKITEEVLEVLTGNYFLPVCINRIRKDAFAEENAVYVPMLGQIFFI